MPNAILYLFFFSFISGVNLPESTAALRETKCANTVLQPSCSSGKVFAIKNAEYGTKLITECPQDTFSDACCTYNSQDCFEPAFTETTLFESCMGKNLCNPSQYGQQDTLICSPNGITHLIYPITNHYLTMEYHCIPGKTLTLFSLKDR